MKASKLQITALAASTFALTSLYANAGLGPGESDLLIVLDPNGDPFAQASVLEGAEDPGALYIVTPPSGNPEDLIDIDMFGQYTNVLEGPEEGGGFSDRFGVVLADGVFALGFMSDGEGVPPDPGVIVAFFGSPGSVTVTESVAGTVTGFDATPYLAPALRDAGYTALFFSDAVPEPSTCAAIVAIGGLAGWRFLRRRRS